MNAQMITLIPEDVSKMTGNATRRELRAQKYLLAELEKVFRKTKKTAEEKQTDGWDDKVQLIENYVTALHGFVAELDHYAGLRMSEPDGRINDWISKSKRKREREKRQRQNQKERLEKHWMLKQLNKEGVVISWDLSKFKLVARDRGYQTDEGIIYAIGQEVGLSRIKAKTLFETGRFTWGQVMCIGAMFEMTPKEFCDIFLSGYFVEEFGEFRASFDNIDKAELLKSPISESNVRTEAWNKSQEKRKEREEQERREKEMLLEYVANQKEPEFIEVGADGSPVDEKWWDD